MRFSFAAALFVAAIASPHCVAVLPAADPSSDIPFARLTLTIVPGLVSDATLREATLAANNAAMVVFNRSFRERKTGFRRWAEVARKTLTVASGAVKAGVQRAKDYVVSHPRLVASLAGGAAAQYFSRKYLVPYLSDKPAAPVGAEPAGDGAPLVPVSASFGLETFDDEESDPLSSSSSGDDELARPEAAALGPPPVSFPVETVEE